VVCSSVANVVVLLCVGGGGGGCFGLEIGGDDL